MQEIEFPTVRKNLAPTARRMMLGNKLRRLREGAGMTRAEAGHLIRGSESKISRLELGRVSFKERDVIDLLAAYGVTDQDEYASLMDLVYQSNQPSWWRSYSDVAAKWFDDYLGLEESAARIKTYQLQYVPGLMQTEDYARAVMRRHKPEPIVGDVERRVAVRMRRKLLLTGPEAPLCIAIVDESVLYRRMEDERMLRAQLEHLLELMELPNISLTVVSYRHSGRTMEGAFSLLEFAGDELSDMVYIEHLRTALYFEKTEEVAPYQKLFRQLAEDSENAQDSRRLIEKVRSTLI